TRPNRASHCMACRRIEVFSPVPTPPPLPRRRSGSHYDPAKIRYSIRIRNFTVNCALLALKTPLGLMRTWVTAGSMPSASGVGVYVQVDPLSLEKATSSVALDSEVNV